MGPFSQDVYLHNSVADLSEMQMGDPITFTLQINAKGEPEAAPPIMKLTGLNPNSAKAPKIPYPSFFGVVGKLNPGGNCFVSCPEVNGKNGKSGGSCWGKNGGVG